MKKYIYIGNESTKTWFKRFKIYEAYIKQNHAVIRDECYLANPKCHSTLKINLMTFKKRFIEIKEKGNNHDRKKRKKDNQLSCSLA
jgi:hypothetical protein